MTTTTTTNNIICVACNGTLAKPNEFWFTVCGQRVCDKDCGEVHSLDCATCNGASPIQKTEAEVETMLAFLTSTPKEPAMTTTPVTNSNATPAFRMLPNGKIEGLCDACESPIVVDGMADFILTDCGLPVCNIMCQRIHANECKEGCTPQPLAKPAAPSAEDLAAQARNLAKLRKGSNQKGAEAQTRVAAAPFIPADAPAAMRAEAEALRLMPHFHKLHNGKYIMGYRISQAMQVIGCDHANYIRRLAQDGAIEVVGSMPVNVGSNVMCTLYKCADVEEYAKIYKRQGTADDMTTYQIKIDSLQATKLLPMLRQMGVEVTNVTEQRRQYNAQRNARK